MNHDKMTNISAKRGFLWPSFEIYSGVSGYRLWTSWTSLKNNIMQNGENNMFLEKGFYEIEGHTVMPKETFKSIRTC